MHKYAFTLIAIFFLLKANAQTFYVNVALENPISNNINQTFQLNINNCDDSTELYTCLPSNANDTNDDYFYYDIAIDTSGNLYWLSFEGALYTRKLNDSTSCQFLGSFAGDSDIQSLACDVSGNVFAIGTNGYNDRTEFYEYKPKTKTFSNLGYLPNGFKSSGDIFFFEGRLFWTAHNSTDTTFLVEVNVKTPSQSCYYMDLGKMNPYAAFSLQNGTCSYAYVFNTGNTSSTLYQLDLYAKTISAPICTYPFVINGAASVYSYFPSIIDSNACLPVDSTVCTTMPVTLLNFSATPLNKTVNLQWQTATEINSNYFLIERSTDGTNFATIGKQTAAGNSSVLKQYAFTDNAPLSTNYYRLKEVDLNGNATFSNILLVKMHQPSALTILQNPVQNTLQVQINSGSPTTSSLLLYDFSGRRLKTLSVTNGLQTIDVSSLPAGAYLLQLITSDGQLFNERFVKGE